MFTASLSLSTVFRTKVRLFLFATMATMPLVIFWSIDTKADIAHHRLVVVNHRLGRCAIVHPVIFWPREDSKPNIMLPNEDFGRLNNALRMRF